MTSSFLYNQINRLLIGQGKVFIFNRYEVNQFGKTTDVVKDTHDILGVFHQSTMYIKKNTSTGAETKGKPQPMIITLKEQADNLMEKDIVIINNKKYIVVSLEDVGNFGVVTDISLEVFA
jgi:hypothetical protein